MAVAPAWLLELLVAKSDPAAGHLGQKDRQHRYVEAALLRECQAVAQARRERNVVLNRAAFNLGQLVGGGVLDRGQVEASFGRSRDAPQPGGR